MFSHFQQPFLFLDRLCYLNTPHILYHSTSLCLFIPESLSACHHFHNSTHCLQPYLQSIKHRFRTDWWWLIDFFSQVNEVIYLYLVVGFSLFQQVTSLCQYVTSGCLYEWLIESFVQLIQSNICSGVRNHSILSFPLI